MKALFLTSAAIFALCMLKISLAANYSPVQFITFYNASVNNITAQIGSFTKFTLAAYEKKIVAYSTLRQACSDNPTHCKAYFYVNNVPAGSAIIDTISGKILNMNLSFKVRTLHFQNMLHSVTIK